jgi:hypothetical protein
MNQQAGDKQKDSQEVNLENLLRQLHMQIKSSDWLQTNTADKFEQENPDLIKAWKQEIQQNENEPKK